MSTDSPRPLFIYGTLRAMPLLSWALTGDSKQTGAVQQLARPAIVKGYARFSVRGCDYPAVVRDESDHPSLVDGYLLRLQTTSQRRKLDDFEGETYKVTTVVAHLQNDSCEAVEGDMYVWDGDSDAVDRTTPWDPDVFIKTWLKDWIELFAGMELVGEDSE